MFRSPGTVLDNEIIPYVSLALQQSLLELPLVIKEKLLEIRLRVGRPVMLVLDTEDINLSDGGVLLRSEMDQTLQFLTQSSIYAREEELRQGFITIPGGHRVGIVGKAVLHEGQIRTLKHISSLNIRLARQVIGVSDQVLPYLMHEGEFISTLLVSPPGCGKTTLLRDLVRHLSTGSAQLKVKGHKIAIVDERSEIAACYQGIPQNDIGPRTDVLDGAGKGEGIMLVLRSMSPEIIATDEVGSPQDIAAMAGALVSGVRLIATAHGDGYADLEHRAVLRNLVKGGLFGRIVFLGKGKHPGVVAAIYSGYSLEPIFINPSFERKYGGVPKIARRFDFDLCYR